LKYERRVPMKRLAPWLSGNRAGKATKGANFWQAQRYQSPEAELPPPVKLVRWLAEMVDPLKLNFWLWRD